MSNVTNMATTIMALKPSQVVRNELVKQQFINVYNAVWREGGEQAYEREAFYFQSILRDKPNLKDCTSLSFYFAFIDIAVQGISLEPGPRAMCYLLPRNFKIADPTGRDVWEKRCNLTISGFGELFLRQRAGQIKYADNPVIVYEGDEFEFGEHDGKKFVNYTVKNTHNANKIVACFMKIIRTDGSYDYSVMYENDWQRLAQFSGKNNAYYDKSIGRRVEKPNELYTSANGGIDPGFLAAKCIKHAFRSYPKLQIGKGSQLETEMTEPDFDPYGGLDQAPAAAATTAAPSQEQKQDDSFAEQPDTSAGVTVDPGKQTAEGDADDVF